MEPNIFTLPVPLVVIIERVDDIVGLFLISVFTNVKNPLELVIATASAI
jgi:hypothetical protein